MECIRFCKVTMPTKRFSSTTGISVEFCAVILRKAAASEILQRQPPFDYLSVIGIERQSFFHNQNPFQNMLGRPL